MKRWKNVYFELRSQPSPSFKAHPLSFEQGSLHTGGLVAYRSLSIQSSVISVSIFQEIVVDWIQNIVQRDLGLRVGGV